MAPRRISLVLDCAHKTEGEPRPKEDLERDSGSHLQDGDGKSGLGSLAYSWRIVDVGIRCLGTNRLALDEAITTKLSLGSGLANIPSQPPRSDFCDGLLYGANCDV